MDRISFIRKSARKLDQKAKKGNAMIVQPKLTQSGKWSRSGSRMVTVYGIAVEEAEDIVRNAFEAAAQESPSTDDGKVKVHVQIFERVMQE